MSLASAGSAMTSRRIFWHGFKTAKPRGSIATVCCSENEVCYGIDALDHTAHSGAPSHDMDASGGFSDDGGAEGYVTACCSMPEALILEA